MIYRLTSVLQPVSGLPSDRITNSVHVRSAPGDDVNDLAHLCGGWVQFWVGEFGIGPLVGMQADVAKSIADGGHEVRVYTYDEVTGLRTTYEGAPPEFISPFNFDAERGPEQLGLANETCIKVTLRNTTEVQVPMARRTGGFMFGPVETLTGSEGDGDFNVPNSGFRTRLLDATELLVEWMAASGHNMVVWSRPYEGRPVVVRPGKPDLPALPAREGSIRDVEQVFVDDEWDTLRKRGRKAGARTFRFPDLTP